MMSHSQISRPNRYNIVISCERVSQMQSIFDWLLEQHPRMKPVSFIGQTMTRLIRPVCVISMSYPHKFGKQYYRVVLSFKNQQVAMMCKLRFGDTYIPVKRVIEP